MQPTRKTALALPALAALGLAALPQAARAQGTITFENVPNVYHAGFQGGGGQPLGSYYQGVTFGANAYVYNDVGFGYPPHSGTSELFFTGTSTTVLFTAPSAGTSFWYTNGSLQDATLTATLAGGGTQQYTLPKNYASNSLFSIAGSIMGFTLSTTGAAESISLDDLRGSGITGAPAAATPVPEPSGVAAFAFTGLGAAGLMLRARKRQAA